MRVVSLPATSSASRKIEQLVAVERPAVDLGADEDRHDVVAGTRLLRLDVLHEVDEELTGRLRGRLGGLSVASIVASDQRRKSAAVAVGDPEQLRDHHQRERRGDEVDEVEHAGVGRAIEHARARARGCAARGSRSRAV